MPQRAKQPENWENLVVKQENRLYRTALAILGCPQQAEQAVQAAFQDYLEKTSRNVEDPGMWLLKRLVNRCGSCASDAAESCVPREAEAENRSVKAFFSLEWEERVILHLFYCEGCSSDEIGWIIGRRPGAVRLRLVEARERLRSLIENEGA